MPTLPLHHGCREIQRTNGATSACSGRSYSLTMMPPDSPVPRTSTRTSANPRGTSQAAVRSSERR